jgi:triacylglycerol lipase
LTVDAFTFVRMTTSASSSFVKDQKPAPVPIWREALVGVDWLSLRSSPIFYGCGVPRGDGAAVVLVPGFLASDWYLFEIHAWLARIGYRPELSRVGRNADCLDVIAERLFVTIEAARVATGRPVHLIGHSLGGMLARSAATRRPDLIASVTTLGSPFRGIRGHPLVLFASDRVRDRLRSSRAGEGRPDCYTGFCSCPAVGGLMAPFPASITQIAVYTRSDGIVDWRYCINGDPATDFEVSGTHIGLVVNPAVYRLIATHLAAVGRPVSPAGTRV